MGRLGPSHIVGIGASAGGLEAYKGLLDALPATTGMAFVIISHISPTATNQLANILSRHTDMPVDVVADGKQIWPNHVYVIPPNSDLRIENQAFKVTSPRAARGKQVDIFLISLAEAMGANAIGVILSGYGGDGALGCKNIKLRGGTTFAQDRSAAVEGMPLSARAEGCIDFVMSPEEMAKKLRSLARKPESRQQV